MDKGLKQIFGSPVAYYPVLGERFGMCGALLIQQILYWCDHNASKKKNVQEGQHWSYNTYQGWAEAIGTNVSAVRRTLADLIKQGIVLVGNFSKGNYNRTNWYRVDTGRLRVLLKSTEQTPSIEQNTPPHLSSTITETTTETTTDILATQKPTCQSNDYNPDETLEIETMAMTKEILAQYANKPKLETKPNTPKSLEMLWKTLVPKYNKKVPFIPAFTMAQKGQLSHMIKQWGDKSDETLTHIIKNWTSFAVFVTTNSGVKLTPENPTIGFVLKYVGDARNFVINDVQLTAKKITKNPSITKEKQNYEAVAEVPEHVVEAGQETSLDDVLKWKPTKKGVLK